MDAVWSASWWRTATTGVGTLKLAEAPAPAPAPAPPAPPPRVRFGLIEEFPIETRAEQQSEPPAWTQLPPPLWDDDVEVFENSDDEAEQRFHAAWVEQNLRIAHLHGQLNRTSAYAESDEEEFEEGDLI